MNYTAKTLLTKHKMMVARQGMIQKQISQLLADQSLDEKIYEIALASRNNDGMPRTLGTGKPTEYIALNYRDILNKQTYETIQALETELHDVQYFLSLYDVAIKALNDKEAHLVRLHYESGLTFRIIVEKNIALNGSFTYSESTLKRMNKEIQNKINSVLGNNNSL